MFSFMLFQLAALLSTGDSVTNSSTGETIADRLWLWSHPAGAYGNYFDGAPYNGWRSRITPVEAAASMDIHNLIFIWVDQQVPPPPHTQDGRHHHKAPPSLCVNISSCCSTHMMASRGVAEGAYLLRQSGGRLRCHPHHSVATLLSTTLAGVSAVSTGDTGVGLGRVNHVCVCYRVLGTAS
jgi:hypothetical protein